MHSKVALVLLAVSFVAFWGLPTLVIPFAADQNWFSLGARTILHGGQLYRDFNDQKAPLIYLLYAIPQSIAGPSFDAVRVFDLFVTLLGMGGVYLLAKRFLPERAAIFAGAVYGFVYLTTVGSDGLGETESFIVAPLTCGLALYPVGRSRWSMVAALASGVLLGVAVGLKLSVGPFVLALPLLEWLSRDREEWRVGEAFWRLTLAAVGFLLVQAAWIGYLAFVGVLAEFIDIQRHYTIPYQSLHWAPNHWSFPRFVFISSGEWMSKAWYITAPAWFGLLMLLGRRPRISGYLFGVLIAFAIASVWWQGKFFQYHWIITLPFLAIPVGYLVNEAIERLSGLSDSQYAVTLFVAVFGIVMMLSGALVHTFDAYGHLYDRLSGNRTQAEIDVIYNQTLDFNHQLVDYVVANSGPNEPFVIWGTWPQALFWADRPTGTNFITNPPLRAKWAPEKWRLEYIADLKSSRPRFFAVADGDRQPWLTGTDRTSREDFCDHFPALRTLIESNYQPVLNNGLFILYDRKAPAATAPGACG